MPLIEVIPDTKAVAAPGWVYVPDTRFDPSKKAIVPSGARLRARDNVFAIAAASSATGGNELLSQREQNKIAKHLTELDKENYKDVQIFIPDRPKDVAVRGLRGKAMTSAVRKILQSQKIWKNHLEDDEASLALQKPSTVAKRPSAIEVMNIDDSMEVEEVITPVSTLDPQIAALIHVDVPKLPSRAELEVLLSAPPLSYNAARAAPSSSSAPPRHFCEICGYWGRARCMKCAARVCGLDCKRAHEETRCQRFYA